MANAMKEWTDATTYSRGDIARIPTSWSYRTESLSIYLTCAHRHYPGKWIIVCREVGADPAILKMPASENPEPSEIQAAQIAAVSVVKSRLQKMIDSL